VAPMKDALVINMKRMKMRKATIPPRHVKDKIIKQAPPARSVERKPRVKIRISAGIMQKVRLLKAKAVRPRMLAATTQASQS